MMRLLVGAWIVSLALAAHLLGQGGTVSLSVELPDNPAAGARLFVEKSCVRCHALGGEEPKLGPDLGRIYLRGTALDLAGAFWNHAPVMREKMRDLKIQAPTLTSRDMADLVAFLTAYRYYLTEVGEPANAEIGRRVLEAKGCLQCHSADNGDGKPGPNLARYRGRFSAVMLAQAMWNHGPEMASLMRERGIPWPKFKDREMGDLLAYLQAGSASVGQQRIYFEPGSPRRGRELFSSKRCIACHAIAGSGGRGGPDLGSRRQELIGPVPTIAGLMWNHSVDMLAEFQRRGIPRITFSGQEMADIIAYLYFVSYANVRGTPSRGAQLFVDKCSTCHSFGGGVGVGPDLASVPGLNDLIAVIATMWNHAAKMEDELRKQGRAWPRFESGETADLAAFLLTRQDGRGPPAGSPDRKP